MFRNNTRHKRTFCNDMTVEKWSGERNASMHRQFCISPNVEQIQDVPRLDQRTQITIFDNPGSELLRSQ